jgi:cobalt-zinc-cadmium efflux system membrane fusion protein
MSSSSLPGRNAAERFFMTFLGLASATLLLLALWGCRPEKPSAPAAAAPKVDGESIEFPASSPQLKEFRVEPAASDGAAPLTLTGRLAWNEDMTVRVLPPVSGRIVSLHAALGSRVGSGGLLATLSSPDFGQAQSDAVRAATDLAASERNHDRVARLFERGAAPRKDLEAAGADLARARAEANRTAARLLKWGGDPSAPPDQLYRVTAPLPGFVVERNANPGQEVRPDVATALFVVTDPSHLWVLVDVTERDLSAISKGDRLGIHSSAYPGRTFTGRLDIVGDALDPATRTVKARGSVDNSSGLLKAEMYVAIDDVGGKLKPVPLVPARSVLTDGGKRYCFVEEGPARFRRTRVEVGVERNGRVPVLSGLSEGARVVTDGSLLLSALFASGQGS